MNNLCALILLILRETQLRTELEITLQFSELLLIQAAFVQLRGGKKNHNHSLCTVVEEELSKALSQPVSLSILSQQHSGCNRGFKNTKGGKVQRNNTHNGLSEY